MSRYLNTSAGKLLNFDPHELTQVADESRGTYEEEEEEEDKSVSRNSMWNI